MLKRRDFSKKERYWLKIRDIRKKIDKSAKRKDMQERYRLNRRNIDKKEISAKRKDIS